MTVTQVQSWAIPNIAATAKSFTVSVTAGGDRYSIDFGVLAQQMISMIDEN